MSARRSFPDPVLATIRSKSSLKVRAGQGSHRFLGIWAVVVDDRVFVRSWNDKPSGWYRAWRDDPSGAILVGDRELPVRAVQVRGERLRDRVSAAYLEKYWRPGSATYARGMNTPERRTTTLELTPLPPERPSRK
jgi:hypothetical protein